MPRVTLVPLGAVLPAELGEPLLAVLNRRRAPVGQSCSGFGVCGHCRVRIVAGQAGLAAPSEREARLAAARELGPDERLACLATVEGDVALTTSYW